jgi:hypothetical protein
MSLPVRPGGSIPLYDIVCASNVECSVPATSYEIYVVNFINSFVNNINRTTQFNTPPSNNEILALKETLFIYLKNPPADEYSDEDIGGAKKRNKSKRRDQKKSNKKSRRHRNRKKRVSRRNAKRLY